MAKVTITAFGIEAGTERNMYVKWNWKYAGSKTKEYKVNWEYYAGTWLDATVTTTIRESTYTVPPHATKVRVRIKPVSATYTKNKKTVSYFTGAEWTSWKKHNFGKPDPVMPDSPNLSLNGLQLTASVSYSGDATHIVFSVVKDDTTTVFSEQSIKLSAQGTAAYVCPVEAGHRYKARCRAYRYDDTEYSEWSAYSDNKETGPAGSAGITAYRAITETSVLVEWAAAPGATSYTLEYATEISHFNGSDLVKSQPDITTTSYQKSGLEPGHTYYFRVKAVNATGESGWTAIAGPLRLGTKPSPPTTWSSSTTVVSGEDLVLYWLHNSEDGSSQNSAEIEFYVDGELQTWTVDDSAITDEDGKTKSYTVNTGAYAEGAEIQWRVRTSGITLEYSDWSIQRAVTIYAPPTLSISWSSGATITSYPIQIRFESGPLSQKPVGYHMSIISRNNYEVIDEFGNVRTISRGDEIYSKHFDITSHKFRYTLDANDIELHNGLRYMVICTVSMDSGLTCQHTGYITVDFAESEVPEPDAVIGIDSTALTAEIMPYCRDSNGDLLSHVTLSVYRREYNGTFTEIITDLKNEEITVIDPHPALDYARYRIIATDTTNGSSVYTDVVYPVGETAIVIQWAEEWSNYNVVSEDALAEPAWSGSILKLPYNIDVSDDSKPEVELVGYIGRKRRVSYYGTQLDEAPIWNTAIPKHDTETLYALRRLSAWVGDVYMREPSGCGFWANVNVSFDQKHNELTVPVSFTITPVEGGM